MLTKGQKTWLLIDGVGATACLILADWLYEGKYSGLVFILYGYVFMYGIGIHSEKNANQKTITAKPPKKPNDWRKEYLTLKGWDNMSEEQRRVVSTIPATPAMAKLAKAMREELKGMKANKPLSRIEQLKYWLHKILQTL